MNRLYAISLYLYPSEFRARFGPEMRQLFRDRWSRTSGLAAKTRFLSAIAKDSITACFEERFTSMSSSLFTVRRIVAATATVVVALALGTTALQAFVIPTPSMAATLLPGDHLLVNKLPHAPQRDEMIVFRYHVDPHQTFIKRVIGLPGDHIHLENKQVFRNGQLVSEPYAQHATADIDTFRDNFPSGDNSHILPDGRRMLDRNLASGEITVPPGVLFVLGDNRDISLDSRYFGFVPQENVVGRPWMIYWSYDSSTSKTRWERSLSLPK